MSWRVLQGPLEVATVSLRDPSPDEGEFGVG